MFEPFGTVYGARVKTDRETGRPLGYGFIQMEDEEAAKAIEALDGKEMAGRNLRVNESRERTAPGADRPPRREFGDRPPRREFGDRPPRREFDGERPPRREFGDRPPRREFDGERPPRREFGDRPPRREFDGERPPRREFGDRPPRREFDGERPPRREFGDRPPRREFDGERFPRQDFNSVGDARFGAGSFVPHHEDDYEMDDDVNDYTPHTEEFENPDRRRRPFRKGAKDFKRDFRDSDRPRRPFMKSGPRKKGFRPNEDFDSED